MHFSSYLKWHISPAQNSLGVSLIPFLFLFCLLEEPVLGPDHLGQHLVKCSGSPPWSPSASPPPPPPTSCLPTPPTAPILVPSTLPLKLHWIPWLVDAWWVGNRRWTMFVKRKKHLKGFVGLLQLLYLALLCWGRNYFRGKESGLLQGCTTCS